VTFVAVVLLARWMRRPEGTAITPSRSPMRAAGFVGAAVCASCHKSEGSLWRGSHHQAAMQLAADSTVLGDFNNSIFAQRGKTTRFFRKEGKYLVSTEGPDGKPGEFEVAYTFGWFPLQQYLIPFPGGRLQSLTIAEIVPYLLIMESHNKDELSYSSLLELKKQVLNYGFIGDGQHHLGPVTGQGTHPLAFAGR
jgi:hypothetical protein